MQTRRIASLVMLMLIFFTGSLMAAGLGISSLRHQSDHVRFCYMTGEGQVNLKIQVQRDGVDLAKLILVDGPELPMEYYATNLFYSYFKVEMEPLAEEFAYYFQIQVGEEMTYFGQNGAISEESQVEPFHYFSNSVQTFATPEWAQGAVIYQIFPDRFYNGDLSNDPKTGLIHGNPIEFRSWDQLPANPPRGADFFGGDLQGVLDKLDYLQELGVQAIYFNPIHEALSNHKYDASDYLKVDDQFGSNELFKSLVDEAKKRGIYVIIDGVFNHTGVGFWAFQDVMEKGQASPYADWYEIYDYPVDPVKGNYKSWNGYSSLPALNYDNPEVRDYVLEVLHYWLSLGVKGVRLDAPKEVPMEFWQEFYQIAKEIDPDVLLIGEIWDDASPWIHEKAFDSTMNYLYRDQMIKFFIQRRGRTSTFARGLGNDLTRYPEPVVHVLYNMVSTHDKERFLTLAQGNVDRVKPYVIFQFTFVGAPAIYYGDEIGMEGGPDPDCRRPMIWDESKQNRELKDLYQQMIGIRQMHPALQKGSFRVVFTDDKARVLIFEREYQGERILVVLNNNDQSYTLKIPFVQWNIVGEIKDLLNGGIYSNKENELTIPENGGAVLLTK